MKIFVYMNDLKHLDSFVLKKLYQDGNKIIINKISESSLFFNKVYQNLYDIDIIITDSIEEYEKLINIGAEVFLLSIYKYDEVKSFTTLADIYNYITNKTIVKIIKYTSNYNDEISNFISYCKYYFTKSPYQKWNDIINLESYYFKNSGMFYLAIDVKTKKIVGSIGLENMNDYGILKRFYIDVKYQNMKIGKRLYQKMDKYIKNNTNIKKIYLACKKELSKAHKFYLKNGFIMADKIDINLKYSNCYDYFYKIIK